MRQEVRLLICSVAVAFMVVQAALDSTKGAVELRCDQVQTLANQNQEIARIDLGPEIADFWGFPVAIVTFKHEPQVYFAHISSAEWGHLARLGLPVHTHCLGIRGVELFLLVAMGISLWAIMHNLSKRLAAICVIVNS